MLAAIYFNLRMNTDLVMEIFPHDVQHRDVHGNDTHGERRNITKKKHKSASRCLLPRLPRVSPQDTCVCVL